MKKGRTFGNNVLVKLDEDNDKYKYPSGLEIYIDNSYEPEKHVTVTGEIYGIPKKLKYNGQGGISWDTDLEIQIGDKVVMYYLAVMNAFKAESCKAIFEGNDKYVFISYESLYAVVRDGVIIPVNGYCLIEPCENPEWIRLQERMKLLGLEAVRLNNKNNTDVVYGIARYVGKPVREYVGGRSDKGIEVKPGDTVVMRRISDVPVEFDMHAKLDGGKKYWRVQRRNILAII